ncbi:hypothetical protein D9M68_427310 [compost metagenome]
MRRHGFARARLAQRPDVVDDVRAQVEHGAHHLGLVGVDRQRHVQLHGLAHHGQHARQLGVERHGGAAGAGRFAADVEDVGTLLQQLLAVLQRRLGRRVRAAVGEGIGRDVDDAHHARLREVNPETRGLPNRTIWLTMENGARGPVVA